LELLDGVVKVSQVQSEQGVVGVARIVLAAPAGVNVMIMFSTFFGGKNWRFSLKQYYNPVLAVFGKNTNHFAPTNWRNVFIITSVPTCKLVKY
jgi:hypothetical protein